MTFIVRSFWHVLDPKQWFFCQITYVKLQLELSFLGVKGSTVILRARTSWSVRFDQKCSLFAVLDLYIILDFYLLSKFTKSFMECFRVCNKKWTANSNTGFFVLFCVFFAPCIWQALFFSVGSCSYQLNSQSSTNILLAASEMFTSITSSWTSVSHCTTTEPVLNVKQWATRAHINLAGEARVLTYLVLTGVTVPLGLLEVVVKQVLNFFFYGNVMFFALTIVWSDWESTESLEIFSNA